LEDINRLAKQYPMFVTSYFELEELSQVTQQLPEIHGIFFYLSENPTAERGNSYDYPGVLKAVKTLISK